MNRKKKLAMMKMPKKMRMMKRTLKIEIFCMCQYLIHLNIKPIFDYNAS